MCNLETEGTKFGCGHYIITHITRHIDCGNRYCTKSRRHPPNCSNCQCEKFFGPDAKEVTTLVSSDYCAACTVWYKPGVKRR